MLKMQTFFLSRIRLTYYYPIFFTVYYLIIMFTQKIQLTGPQLTLFSVNSFLLAFYLGPVIGGQKSRVDELTKVIRNEAVAIFNVLIQAQDLHDKTKADVKGMAQKYIKACIRTRKVAEGEQEYENMIGYCLRYKGKDKAVIRRILDILVSNQQNRSQFSMQLQSGVYNHEWLVLFVLFVITIAYILVIDYGDLLILKVVAALLCTGLTLLLLILQKFNTLTHKKAKHIWNPFDKLLETDFKRID